MDKKVDKLKVFTLILALIQLVIVGTFAALYLADFANITRYFLVEYVALVFVILLVLDCVYIFIILGNINKIKKKSDLKTEQLLGEDIAEAYFTAKIGLVVINNDGTVLWQSDYLYKQDIDLVEKNIFKLNESFADLLKGDSSLKITVNIGKQTYLVKYLKNAGLFIFIENTELTELNKYVKEQATCIGIITIDNYNEIAGTSDDRDDIISKVKTKIFDYAKRFKLLLRTLRNDSYFVVCNYKTLHEIVTDRFSILESVKEIEVEGSIKPTLTIGFSRGYPDVNKLNEMAGNAVEVGMSRGGDQAVVAKYGSDFIFYGGKSEIQAKHNTVQIRSVGDTIMNLIDKSSNVYIMGHADMDLDALGAALGVYEICTSVRKPAAIIYDPKLTERKTRGALTSQFKKDELMKMTISPVDAISKIKSTTLVVVVDVSRPKSTLCPELLAKTNKIIVIDHHRRSTDDVIESSLMTYIDPSASSASEIVTEIIKYSPSMNVVKIRPLVATFMMSGIFLDTGFFKNKTVSNRAFEACVVLKSFGADNILADDLLKDEFEEYIFINRIINTLKTPYYGVVYCVVEDDEIVERSVLAKVANQCISLKGISAAFAVGKIGPEQVGISARTDGTINAQILCEKLGGGGHFQSAATVISRATITEAENRLLETLDLYLPEARSDAKVKGNLY